jgi:ribosomal protein S18 acetylase RimI-like enzyme
MDLQFIQCSEKEIPLISNLAFEIWNEYYPQIIGQHQVDYMLDKMYNAAAIKEQMQNGQVFYLVSDRGKNIAFFSFSLKDNHSAFLHKFYVQKLYRGKGIASEILKHFELLLKNKNIKEYRLTVNRQNAQAINFYFKSGFKIEEVADFDIGNGFFMNDFVMIKKLV